MEWRIISPCLFDNAAGKREKKKRTHNQLSDLFLNEKIMLPGAEEWHRGRRAKKRTRHRRAKRGPARSRFIDNETFNKVIRYFYCTRPVRTLSVGW